MTKYGSDFPSILRTKAAGDESRLDFETSSRYDFSTCSFINGPRKLGLLITTFGGDNVMGDISSALSSKIGN